MEYPGLQMPQKNGDKNWCAFVTLDMENAFNTARWSLVIGALKRIGVNTCLVNVIENYFCVRTVEVLGGGRIGLSAVVP